MSERKSLIISISEKKEKKTIFWLMRIQSSIDHANETS
mgnify:CR=1 FL=1